MLAPSTVLFLKYSRALSEVSIRIKVIRASVPWSKRYPSRSAYIFFKGTMGGSGGISKIETIPAVPQYAINYLDGFATGEWRALPGGFLLTFIESGCKLHK